MRCKYFIKTLVNKYYKKVDFRENLNLDIHNGSGSDQHTQIPDIKSKKLNLYIDSHYLSRNSSDEDPLSFQLSFKFFDWSF